MCVLAVAHLSGNAQDTQQVTSRRFQSRAYEGVTLFGSRDAKLYEIKGEGTDLDFSGTEIKVVSSIQQERGAKRRLAVPQICAHAVGAFQIKRCQFLRLMTELTSLWSVHR